MVEISDIKDRDSLRAWLEELPFDEDENRRIAVTIAHRAAMRVLPVYWEWVLTSDYARKNDLTALTILRVSLIAGVAGTRPTPAIRSAAAAYAAAAAAYAAAAAAAAAYAAAAAANTAAANTAAAAAAAAAYAAAAAAAAANTAAVWENIRSDCAGFSEPGQRLDQTPLWRGANPVTDLWMQTRMDFPEGWEFWRDWYQNALDGVKPNWDMLTEIALIDPEDWDKGAEHVNGLIAGIVGIYRSNQRNPLAAAYIFDFVEVDKKLRMIGAGIDFEDIDPEILGKCLEALKDYRDDLKDWRDFAGDLQSGRNSPSALLMSVDKLLAEIDRSDDAESLRLRRFVTLGSDLRRLSLDESLRGSVGETLAAMLDERVTRFSAIAGECFGHVLARLEPLNELSLGDRHPEQLVSVIRAAVERIKSAKESEMAAFEPEARATLSEMIRELDEMAVAISGAENENSKRILMERFAARFGGTSATVGRALEKGREVAGGTVKKFDDLVKWFKRLDTIESVIEWLQRIL